MGACRWGLRGHGKIGSIQVGSLLELVFWAKNFNIGVGSYVGALLEMLLWNLILVFGTRPKRYSNNNLKNVLLECTESIRIFFYFMKTTSQMLLGFGNKIKFK